MRTPLSLSSFFCREELLDAGGLISWFPRSDHPTHLCDYTRQQQAHVWRVFQKTHYVTVIVDGKQRRDSLFSSASGRGDRVTPWWCWNERRASKELSANGGKDHFTCMEGNNGRNNGSDAQCPILILKDNCCFFFFLRRLVLKQIKTDLWDIFDSQVFIPPLSCISHFPHRFDRTKLSKQRFILAQGFRDKSPSWPGRHDRRYRCCLFTGWVRRRTALEVSLDYSPQVHLQ